MTWFTAIENWSHFSTGSHRKLLVFQLSRVACYPPTTATLVPSSSASSSYLSAASAPLIISLLIVFIVILSTPFSPLPSASSFVNPLFVLSLFFLLQFVSARLQVETHILSHPLLWICSPLICRMDTERKQPPSRQASKASDFKGRFYSERINDHSAGKKGRKVDRSTELIRITAYQRLD